MLHSASGQIIRNAFLNIVSIKDGDEIDQNHLFLFIYFFFKDSWVGVIFGLVGESQHVDTRKNIGEIRTGLVDSCGENDAKLEQRKKKIHNCIISMQTAEAM